MMVMALQSVLVLVVLLAFLGVTAALYGTDSRDSYVNDWHR